MGIKSHGQLPIKRIWRSLKKRSTLNYHTYWMNFRSATSEWRCRWTANSKGFTVKLLYLYIHWQLPAYLKFHEVWKVKVPLSFKAVVWLTSEKYRRWRCGCVPYNTEDEDVDHLLIACSTNREIWKWMGILVHSNLTFNSVKEMWNYFRKEILNIGKCTRRGILISLSTLSRISYAL